MKNEERVTQIINRLNKEYPGARTALNFTSPMELLVATILSAQCTDVMVNKVTPGLFAKYRMAEDYANADVEELEAIIKPTGFYHNKAKSIIGAAGEIASKHGGVVPDNMAELIKLPGVARKTANVVLYNAYGALEGIAVDTHVTRLSNLLSLSKQHDTNKIEQDLMRLVPQIHWGLFTYLLISHGRKVCIARKPRCNLCVLSDICPSSGVARGSVKPV